LCLTLNRMNKLTLLLLVLLLFGACESKKTEEQDTESEQSKMYQEVIDIHDKVMPRLQDISIMLENLESRIDSLDQVSGSEEDLAVLRQQMIELDEADESMMNWMRQFQATYDGWDEQKIIDYLKEEKIKISEVDELVDKSIDKAKSLLQ